MNVRRYVWGMWRGRTWWMWTSGKNSIVIISSMFSRRATSFKTAHQKDSETIQGDRQCDPQILNRQAKRGRTVSATRRHISICTCPSSEQHKRDQRTLWPHKKPHLDYLEWSRCSSLPANNCACTNCQGMLRGAMISATSLWTTHRSSQCRHHMDGWGKLFA